MTLYRKVDVDLWDDEKFLALSELAQWVWLVLLTGPNTTAVPGLQLADYLTIASTLRRDPNDVREALLEVERAGMCQVDVRLRMIRLPNAVKRNAPENQNQLRAMWKAWQTMPASPLKFAHLKSILDAGQGRGEWFTETWDATFGTVPQTVTVTVTPTVTLTVGGTAVTAEAQQKHSTKDPLPASPGPGKPGGIGQTNGEGSRRARKPMAEPSGQREVIVAYCEEWVRVCQPADGKSPVLDGADVGAAGMLAKRGLVEATELIKRYLADPDPWISGRGHLLRDLPSRLNAYRRTTGPPPAPGTAKGFARAPTERPKESYDATHEL